MNPKHVALISKEEVYSYLGTPFNPPELNSPADEEAFKEEWWQVQRDLRECLMTFGTEDAYGQGDFLVSESRTDSRGIGVDITSYTFLNPKVIAGICGLLQLADHDYSIYLTSGNTPIFDLFVERNRILISPDECPELPSRLGLST